MFPSLEVVRTHWKVLYYSFSIFFICHLKPLSFPYVSLQFLKLLLIFYQLHFKSMTSLLGTHVGALVRLRKHPQIASSMFMNHPWVPYFLWSSCRWLMLSILCWFLLVLTSKYYNICLCPNFRLCFSFCYPLAFLSKFPYFWHSSTFVKESGQGGLIFV